MKTILTTAAALVLMATTPVQAHFQLLYTPQVNLEKPADLPLKLVFWHPMENGHAMDMGHPSEFFVVHKGEKTDLLGGPQAHHLPRRP